MKIWISAARVFLVGDMQWAFSGPVTIFDGWVKVEPGALCAATDEDGLVSPDRRGEEEIDNPILIPAHRIHTIEQDAE